MSADCFDTADRLLALDDAVDRLLGLLGPVTAIERLPLDRALGRVLAEDLTSALVIPPDDNSAMDGYGVRFADLSPQAPTRLPLTLRVPAGHPADRPLGPGEAARIFTGAPIPKGVDTVIMQEVCHEEDGYVTLPSGEKRGANVRPAGADVAIGQTVLAGGRRLGPVDVAMAAQIGVAELAVRARLKVAVFTTGDEVVEPGQPLPPGGIYNSNRRALLGLLSSLGAECIDLGNLPDRPALIQDALAEAARAADLVVTSGGVSVGGEDHVKDAVAALGSLAFWRLALKPGKPLAFGTVAGKPFLGLPGNPVSTFVTFCLVGRPVVLRLAGVTGGQLRPRDFPVIADFSLTRKPGRREFLRGQLRSDSSGAMVVAPFPVQSSNVVSSIVQSDGLIDIGQAVTVISRGDRVRFIPFSELF
ncbi:molybdopterin molybdenumtransferase MoeA [Rhodospirillum rubrum]|nr:gephyrin-like molybdotransferase Glp [Rhodospirillum rubrum]MBK1664561.1 molybdopterin molybdenumtransferase MoeA [Rhodospirillum rubrum]